MTAQSNVKEMLALAKSCYLKVGPLNMDDSQGEGDLKEEEYIEETEEKWLQHYMLGKVAEKNEADPAVFLKHYLKVSPRSRLKVIHEKLKVLVPYFRDYITCMRIMPSTLRRSPIITVHLIWQLNPWR